MGFVFSLIEALHGEISLKSSTSMESSLDTAKPTAASPPLPVARRTGCKCRLSVAYRLAIVFLSDALNVNCR